ncbi:MAG TPA: hypothetical protein VFX16_03540 [Pseudonocardiaceae bacterium]|nr:hypothetical protein [Pseudonocardiaceae bacterium]
MGSVLPGSTGAPDEDDDRSPSREPGSRHPDWEGGMFVFVTLWRRRPASRKRRIMGGLAIGGIALACLGSVLTVLILTQPSGWEQLVACVASILIVGIDMH